MHTIKVMEEKQLHQTVQFVIVKSQDLSKKKKLVYYVAYEQRQV